MATRLVHDHASHGLPEAPYLASRVSFADLAARLGITRSALYRLWDSQYEFWVDLVRYLAYEHDFSQTATQMPWSPPADAESAAAIIARGGFERLMIDRVNLMQEAVLADDRILIRAASLGYPQIDAVAAVRRNVETRRLGLLAAEIESTLAARGRVVAPPVAAHDLAVAIWCISDGLSVLNRYFPEHCAKHATVDFGSGPASWSVLALATHGVHVGLSEPGSGPGSAHPDRTTFLDEAPSVEWSSAQLSALHAAAELFTESISRPSTGSAEGEGGPGVLEHLTIARVARAAGVTRRTIYNTWADRSEMLADVYGEMLTQRCRDDLAVLTAHRDRSGALLSARAVEELIGPPSDDRAVDPTLAFLLESQHTLFRSMYRKTLAVFSNSLCHGLDKHLEATGRRPRSGITTERLALICWCLIDGGRRLRQTNASSSVAFGAVVDAVVRELTVDVA